MLSTFWSTMSSTDVHILSICPPAMQMIVPRYGQPYGPHTANHTNDAGQHTAAWKSMRYCRRQDCGLSQLKYHLHRLPYRNLQFVQGVLIIESAGKSR